MVDKETDAARCKEIDSATVVQSMDTSDITFNKQYTTEPLLD